MFLAWPVAAAIACAAPAAAQADAPWSAPVDVGPRVARVAGPSIDALSPATALLSWRMLATEPTTLTVSTDRAVIATRGPGDALATQTLPDDAVTQVSCGSGCVAVLRRRTLSPGRELLGVSIGRGPASLGRMQTLSRDVQLDLSDVALPSTPTIAAHPSGAVAVAWVDGAGVRIALRRPGGSFGRPRTIATQPPHGGLEVPRPAFDSRRGVTVAYVRRAKVAGRVRGNVEARRVTLDGALEPARVLGPAPRTYTDLRIVAAPNGRTVVAWGNVHGTVMGYEDRWVVRAAIRAPGARRFAPAQVLDPGAVKAAGAPGRLGLGIASDGTATAAWSAVVRPSFRQVNEVRSARARPGRRFAAPRAIASDGSVSGLAVAPSGAAVVTWATYGADGTAIVAAVRPAGAVAFGAPERVAHFLTSWLNPIAPQPAAGIDDAGAATVVWAAESVAGNPPAHVPMSAALRLATRPAAGS